MKIRLDEHPKKFDLTRRDALRMGLAPLGVAAAGWLIGCTSDGGESSVGEETEGDDLLAQEDTVLCPDAGRDAGSSVDAGRDASVGSDAGRDAGGSPDAGGGKVTWATGGTKSMRGNYPDPFTSGAPGAACVLYPSMTIGPCYAQSPARREDISDGLTGLPVRLSFLVVRGSTCTPVPNAEVDIWHTGSNGVYSAFASGICNPDRLNVASQRFCRGTQLTNADGRTDFSTIFPGWYTGRSIHIHFTVRVGTRSYLTSQLFFEDTLNDEIMGTSEYVARGKRDTTNKSDNILRGVDLSKVVLSWTQRSDGALHAWKVLQIPA